MNVDISKIKELRDKTGISIGECKTALERANGHMDKAVELLKQRGVEIAEKKSTRAIGAGVVDSYIHHTFNSGATVVVGTETDFVARNEDFRKFTHDIAQQVTATGTVSTEQLLQEPWIKDPSRTIGDLVKEQVVKFGENIEIQTVQKFEVGKKEESKK